MVPHPSSPAASRFDWVSLPDFDFDDRVRAVLDAIRVAEKHAFAEVKAETGEELDAILSGMLSGLLSALGVVAATTAIGGLAGAAIGAFAGGVGALPGAAAGASLGLDAGIALLEILGLGFLITSIGSSLLDALRLAGAAVKEAWGAVDDPRSSWLHIDHAGRTLARALGVLMRGILEGVVAFLLAKGAGAVASRVPELVAKLRKSRLGSSFASWIERSWESLLRNERLKPKPNDAPNGGNGTGSNSAGTPAPLAPSLPSPASPRKDPPSTNPPRRRNRPDEPPGKPKTVAERLDELSKDPDHHGKVTPTSRREAEVALDLEQSGRLPPPVRRPVKGDGHSGDFVDGMDRDWDVKRPRSRAALIKDIQDEAVAKGKRPRTFDPNEPVYGEFETAATMKEIRGEIRSGERVIVDTSKMEPAQIEALRSEVTAQGLADHVIFYP